MAAIGVAPATTAAMDEAEQAVLAGMAPANTNTLQKPSSASLAPPAVPETLIACSGAETAQAPPARSNLRSAASIRLVVRLYCVSNTDQRHISLAVEVQQASVRPCIEVQG
jgi:hypothetical protein